MQDIRIWFEKRGRAKYISHLDLMRAMSRAVRRAGLPLWYTEGFHPHPYLSFPLPLPLGQEGLREAMDLRLEEAGMRIQGAGDPPLPLIPVTSLLTPVLPEGLRVLEAARPWAGPGEIRAAEYRVAVPCADPEAWASRAARLLAGGELTARKTGKQGHRKVEKDIALAPLTLRWELAARDRGVLLECTLAAGSEANLNPALLVEALGGEGTAITRVRLLRGDGAEWE